MTVPADSPESGLAAVCSAVDKTGAVGFLQVDRGDTPSRRYLTRYPGPDRETAILVVPASDTDRPQAIYCVPSDVTAPAERFERVDDGIDREVVGRHPSITVGQHACEVLAAHLGERAGSGKLLVPRDLPHDTALFCQQAGYELQSTGVVRAGQTSKTDAERDCLQAVQQAAIDGMARAEAVLAASNHDSGLLFEGRPLTVERLRREINTKLASIGVSPADNTQISASAIESTDQLPVGEPLCIHLAPRGPHGYHAHLTRTFVVDSDGGWERRAAVAAEAGLRAATRQLEPGVDVSAVEGEIVAEIGAYGFAVAAEPETNSRPRATATVHGVGLSTHERPTPATTSTIRAGSVLAIEAGVVDSMEGTIQLGALWAVTPDRNIRLAASSSSLTPTNSDPT